MIKRVIYSILTIVLSLSIIGLACSEGVEVHNDVTVDSTTTTSTTIVATTTTTVLGTTTTTTVAGTTTTTSNGDTTTSTTVVATTTTTVLGTTTTTTVAVTTTTTTTVPTYTITFDANGGTGTMANQTFISNTSSSLILNSFTKSGWSFVGWATSAGETVVYTDGDSYTMGASDVTLYAKWSANNYTITFDKNDGSATGTMTNQTILKWFICQPYRK